MAHDKGIQIFEFLFYFLVWFVLAQHQQPEDREQPGVQLCAGVDRAELSVLDILGHQQRIRILEWGVDQQKMLQLVIVIC